MKKIIIKNCGECPKRGELDKGYCGITRRIIVNNNQSVPDWCPLKDDKEEKINE